MTMQRSSLVEEIVVDTVDDDVYAVRTCYSKRTTYNDDDCALLKKYFL